MRISLISYIRTLLLVWLLAFGAVCTPAPAQAQHIHLTNLVIDNEAGNIMVRYSVTLEQLDDLATVLRDGATLAMECKARLERDRDFWLGEVVAEREWTYVLGHDGLTREFLLQVPGNNHTQRDRDLARLLRRQWETIDVDMGPFSLLQRNNQYLVELTVQLTIEDVPEWLRGTLFFWSWDVAPKVVYQMEFDY